MTSKLISQGAEAKIFLVDGEVIKDRISKGYRHSQIDSKIRKGRTKREEKILKKAGALGVNVPRVFDTGYISKVNMEYIDGDKLSDTLNSYEEEKQFEIMKKIGEQVGLLHLNNIIHGDLTTSNVILKDDKVFIIDFGLGFISAKVEDMAVDLHLIKQALEAKHFENWEKLFDNFFKGYNWDKSYKVGERLNVVEKRGRYKH